MLTAAVAPITCRWQIIGKPCAHAVHRRARVHLLQLKDTASATRTIQCHVAAAMTDHSIEVRALLDSTNQQWLEHALSTKLTDEESGITVVLLGVCFFAPMQQQLVQSALQQLVPDYIAIEQPPETSSNILLPHPVWVQALIDNMDAVHDAINNFEQPTEASLARAAATAGSLQQLEQQLQDAGHPQAAVGKTIADPWETFGFYAGMDLYKQPATVLPVLQLCGFLPGHELLVAVQHAMRTGASLKCIDASIKLQERWVKQLLQNFALDEQQVKAYQPIKDLNANQQLLPDVAAAWDRQLAATAQQLRQAVQAAQTGRADAVQGGAPEAVAASSVSTADQQELLLFQVSRGSAAAMLSPAAAQDAFKRLQRLQPLKWAHFALRQRYLARQIKELCATAGKAAGRQPAVAVWQQQPAPPVVAASSTDISELPLHSQLAAPSSAKASDTPVTVLAVVGRQHVHGLAAMWKDANSSLWRDRMPRSFAASSIENPEQATSDKPDTATKNAYNSSTENASSLYTSKEA